MTSPSQLIQPLISTEAFSTLQTVVPSADVDQDETLLPSRAVGASRYRQALLTSIPLAFADILGITASYITATIATYGLFQAPHASGFGNNLLALCLCHLLIGCLHELYPASGMNPVRELRNQLTSVAGAFLVLVGLNGIVGEVTFDEVLIISLAFPMTFLAAPVARFGMRKICAPFGWWGEKVIIVGNTHQGLLVHAFLERNPQRGLKPLGIVDENPSHYWTLNTKEQNVDFLGTTPELVTICRDRRCHWVIAAVADKSESEVRQILACGSLIPNLVVLNTNLMIPTMWVDTFDAAGLAGVYIRDRLLFPYLRLTKRLIDFSLSGLILLLVSPLLLIMAVWIKCVSPGPVFFRHYGRIGRGGKTFGALKIRTMVPNADEKLQHYLNSNAAAKEEWNRDLKLRNDPRIIPGIGSFLRRTSLDELPQLWNVIVGDMSLVGPRPIYTDIEVEKFLEFYPLYLRVRPGLTGLWQVSGRNNTSYEDRVRLDSYYVRNWSLWLDYFILLRTVRTVFLREGSY